jgi:ADP-heptose:LPS heptosyltransferase
MNIELTRNFDYYVGVPLCFLGSILKKLFNVFEANRKPVKPTNALFIELSEMGSVILADPAMVKLKCSLDVTLYFAIFRKNSSSLELLETVPKENIFIMDDSGIWEVAMSSIRFFFWAREKQIDTVIDLELFSRFTALLTGFSGAGRTVGFHAFHNEGLYRGNFLTHKVAYNPHLHISKNFIALVNALLADNNEIPYSKSIIRDEEVSIRTVEVSETKKQAVIRKIEDVFQNFSPMRHNILLFNTNSSDLMPLRRWPQDYYIRLARMILEEYPDIVILCTGSRDERTGAELLVEAIGGGRCVNFAGKTTVTELLALYSVSTFMLTNDSGPAHFASVTSLPVFVFFGPETPAMYGPLGLMTPIYSGLACSPCVSAANHRKSACNNNTCLQMISPEHVIKILRPILEQLRNSHP